MNKNQKNRQRDLANTGGQPYLVVKGEQSVRLRTFGVKAELEEEPAPVHLSLPKDEQQQVMHELGFQSLDGVEDFTGDGSLFANHPERPLNEKFEIN